MFEENLQIHLERREATIEPIPLQNGGKLYVLPISHGEGFPTETVNSDALRIKPHAIMLENMRAFGPGLDSNEGLTTDLADQLKLAQHLQVPIGLFDTTAVILPPEMNQFDSLWLANEGDMHGAIKRIITIGLSSLIGGNILKLGSNALKDRSSKLSRRSFNALLFSALITLLGVGALPYLDGPIRDRVVGPVINSPGPLKDRPDMQLLLNLYTKFVDVGLGGESTQPMMLKLRNYKALAAAEEMSQFVQCSRLKETPRILFPVGLAHIGYLQGESQKDSSSVTEPLKEVFLPTYNQVFDSIRGDDSDSDAIRAVVQDRAVKDLLAISLEGVYRVNDSSKDSAAERLVFETYLSCPGVIKGIQQAIKDLPDLSVPYTQSLKRVQPFVSNQLSIA